uniref:Arginine-hydroxylase NDUFAF5, mitochondrial n=1 Tax=Mesocestoides corti TaxID=53468 RepID=A0A5K3EM54_MESCO
MLRIAKYATTGYRVICFSTLSRVFDRKAKKLQRARASLRDDPSLYDYIRDEAAFRLADRVCDITRTFDTVADLGCGRSHLIQHLTSDSVKFVYQCDNSIEILNQQRPSPDVINSLLNIDEERLPFKDNSLDMIITSLSLHWVNDLPATLSQVLRSLKPDGCLLGVTFTVDTLFELRVSLQLAEAERLGGFACHVSPFVESSRFGELLKEQGFSLISLESRLVNVSVKCGLLPL